MSERGYRVLNPATKLLLAAVLSVACLTARSWYVPAAILAVWLAIAAQAGALRPLGKAALALAPVAASALLINGLWYPGAGEILFRAGPLQPSRAGLVFGLHTDLRLLGFSLAPTLVMATTRLDDLLAELAVRGTPRRLLFLVGSTLTLAPRLQRRAREISEAQRCRGLRTEGPPWRRAAALLPLIGPLVLSTLVDAEEHALGLESRGFDRPGKPTILRRPPDSPRQRALRWALLASLPAVFAAWFL